MPDPADRIAQLAAALRPGGLLAIEDYERNTLRMLPTPPAWDAFLAADHAFFASQGGHASIAGLLPGYYARAGLTLVDDDADHQDRSPRLARLALAVGVLPRRDGSAGRARAGSGVPTRRGWRGPGSPPPSRPRRS